MILDSQLHSVHGGVLDLICFSCWRVMVLNGCCYFFGFGTHTHKIKKAFHVQHIVSTMHTCYSFEMHFIWTKDIRYTYYFAGWTQWRTKFFFSFFNFMLVFVCVLNTMLKSNERVQKQFLVLLNRIRRPQIEVKKINTQNCALLRVFFFWWVAIMLHIRSALKQ